MRPAAPGGGGPFVLGVTGRIASGKSLFCHLVAEAHGRPVIDADAIGHAALRPASPLLPVLLRRFGPTVGNRVEGIDRTRLGALVFSDPAALADLNRLVHPFILEEIARRVAALKAGGEAGIILLEAALLLTWLHRYRPDGIVLVRAPWKQRIARLEGRGLSRSEAVRRARLQEEGAAERESAVDWVVENDGGMEDLRGEVARVYNAAVARFGIR